MYIVIHTCLTVPALGTAFAKLACMYVRIYILSPGRKHVSCSG